MDAAPLRFDAGKYPKPSVVKVPGAVTERYRRDLNSTSCDLNAGIAPEGAGDSGHGRAAKEGREGAGTPIDKGLLLGSTNNVGQAR